MTQSIYWVQRRILQAWSHFRHHDYHYHRLHSHHHDHHHHDALHLNIMIGPEARRTARCSHPLSPRACSSYFPFSSPSPASVCPTPPLYHLSRSPVRTQRRRPPMRRLPMRRLPSSTPVLYSVWLSRIGRRSRSSTPFAI